MNIDGKPENIKFNSLLSRIQMFETKATHSSNNNNNEKRKEPMKIKRFNEEPKKEEMKIINPKNEEEEKIDKPKEEEKENKESLKLEEEPLKVEEQLKKEEPLIEEESKIEEPKNEELKIEEQSKIKDLPKGEELQKKEEPNIIQTRLVQLKAIPKKEELKQAPKNSELPILKKISSSNPPITTTSPQLTKSPPQDTTSSPKNTSPPKLVSQLKKTMTIAPSYQNPILSQSTIQLDSSLKKTINNENSTIQTFESQNEDSKNILRHSNTIAPQNRVNPLNVLQKITPNEKGEIFLNSIEIPEEVKNESFCEGFFIASIPKENGKVEEGSDKFKSDCGHHDCSSLLAMQPEIIYRYPEKDTKDLEINNLAASICFPSGIKICYEEDKLPIVVKNYYSSITNQTGDRFFIVTYHFYIRMMNINFVQMYQIHPIKYETMKFCNDFYEIIEDNPKLQSMVQSKLEKFGELNFREIVNVPFCLCLISRYPFFNLMEKCLESIKQVISDYNSTGDELHKLVKYIVKEIPFPKQHYKIEFPLPLTPDINELTYPYFEDLTFLGPNPALLLNYFSVENIILIFRLILFEQKILFIDSELQRLGEVTNAFISILYPFQWVHTFIPIMSTQMLKYLQAFLPFINGLHVNLFDVAKTILDEADEGVYLVYIGNNTIDINWDSSSKRIKIAKKINENIPLLPKHIEKELYNNLNNIKTMYEKGKKDPKYRKNYNVYIYNLIMQIFVEMLYDYMKYLTVIDDYPIFNTNLLLNSRPKADEKFYKEFTETQIFQLFIQNAIKKNNNMYFNERIKLYQDLKDKEKSINEKLTNEFFQSWIKSREIEKICVIKPYFLKLKENYSNLEELKKVLQQSYPINPNSYNKKGITKEDKRSIGQNLKLEYSDKSNVYNFYHIPNTPINLSGIEGKSKITARASMYEKRVKLNQETKTSSIRINAKKSEWALTDNEKDEVKDNIKDILSKVLKCEDINENEDKKQLINCIESVFGRNYFIDIIYQKNISERTEKALNKSSFNLLTTVIYNAILSILKLDENKENINYAVLLIKSSQIYYMVEKNKNVYVINALYNKFKGLNLLTKINFWEEWFNISLKEEPNYKRNDPSNDKIVLKILNQIINFMLNSKIQQDIIFNIATSISNKMKNEDEKSKFKKDLTDILKKHNY